MTVIFTAKDIDNIGAEVEEVYNKLRGARSYIQVLIGIFYGSLEDATEFGLYFASEVACYCGYDLSRNAVITYKPRWIIRREDGNYETEIFIAAYKPVNDPQ